jgi:hypothetical protein
MAPEIDTYYDESDVAVLKRIVYEGNGVPPLTTRVSSLETKMSAILWLCGLILTAVVTDILTHVNWQAIIR